MKLEKITNSLKKIPKTLALATGLAAGIASTDVEAQRKFTDYVDFHISGEAAVLREYSGLEMKKVPEEIRNVPMHSSDVKRYTQDNWQPLGSSSIDQIEKGGIYSAYAGLEFGKRVTIGAMLQTRGPTLHIASDAGEDQLDKEFIARRNYSTLVGGDKRQWGTAFTYYGNLRLDEDKKNPLKGLFAKVKLHSEPVDNGEWCLYLNYDYVKDIPIKIDAGWDRHNSFEVKETFKLGEIDSHKFFIDFKLQGPQTPFTAGAYAGMGFFTKFKQDERFKIPGEVEFQDDKPVNIFWRSKFWY